MFWDILEMFFRLQELLFYKMKLEAMKRQAGRPRKNSVPVAQEFRGKTSREILYLIFDYPHKHYTFKYFEV